MNALFALIIVFNQDPSAQFPNGAVSVSRVTVFATQALCDAALPDVIAYQRGRESTSTPIPSIKGFCVPVVMAK